MTQAQIKETETFNMLLKKLAFPIDHLVAEELNDIMKNVFTGNAGKLKKWETEEGILTYLMEICEDNQIRSLHQLLEYYRKKSAQLFGALYINEALEAVGDEYGSEHAQEISMRKNNCIHVPCNLYYPMVIVRPEKNLPGEAGTDGWEINDPKNSELVY